MNIKMFLTDNFLWLLWCLCHCLHCCNFIIKYRGQTDRVTVTTPTRTGHWPMTTTFNRRRAMVMTLLPPPPTHTTTTTRVQSSQSVEKTGWKQTGREMDAIDCLTFPAKAIGKYSRPTRVKLPRVFTHTNRIASVRSRQFKLSYQK